MAALLPLCLTAATSGKVLDPETLISDIPKGKIMMMGVAGASGSSQVWVAMAECSSSLEP